MSDDLLSIQETILKAQEPDLLLVKQIAEKWGYGRLMQFLSQEWYKKDPEGALTVGQTYSHFNKVNQLLDNLIGDYKFNDAELTAEDEEVLAKVFAWQIDPDEEMDNT